MKTYFDIQGDGGSNILGQVQAFQSSIAESLSSVGQLVAVGSGKGGVGKSTVTMALAQALHGRDHEVAILDADFNGPCQAKLAGLEGVPWVPGEEGMLLPRRKDGLGVLSFGSILAEAGITQFETVSEIDEFTWRATKEFTALGQLLASVEWGSPDFLLIDLPPGAERIYQYAQFLGAQASFVLVTIPSQLSRGVVARSITALERAEARALGYVENMAGYFCHDCGEVRPLFPPAETELSLPRLGSLPFDPRMAELCDRGWPTGEAQELGSFGAVEKLTDQMIQALEET